ncbi:MAG: ABC transporter substrate-binding protein [Phycisphaera sp.]|nr:ABC transporter substrate-binding protein [Phycisphaera sp.]
MFFGRMKRSGSDEPAPKVPLLQRAIALSCSLALIWLLFAPNSPFATKPPAKRADSAVVDAAPGAAGGAAGSEAGAQPRVAAPKSPSPRIASTSPAITDSLVALGLEAHVVGRSPFCKSVSESVPVVGDLRDFDAERLALSGAEVLFVQPPLAGVDPALRAYCESKSIRLVARRLESLADVERLVDDIAAVFGVEPNVGGSVLERSLGGARASIKSGVAAPEGARQVLLLVSADPFLAAGRGTYLDELLAGATMANQMERTGYIELSAEAIAALGPTTVLGVTESAAGAARMRELLERVPWGEKGAPAISVSALPELLSPSLVAVAKRDELVRLAEAAR